MTDDQTSPGVAGSEDDGHSTVTAKVADETAKPKKVKRPRPALLELLAQYETMDANRDAAISQVHAAFTRLAEAIGSGGPTALTVPQGNRPQSDAAVRILALELSLHGAALKCSKGQSALWCANDPDWPLYAQVALSSHISSRDLSREAHAAEERRKAAKELPGTLVQSHEFYRVEDHGIWAPGLAAEDAERWRNIAPLLPAMLNPRLPLGREIATRQQLIALGSLGRRSEQDASLRLFPLAKRALERALEAARSLSEDGAGDDEQAWTVPQRVFEVAGRNPNALQSLTRTRLRLISAGVADLPDRSARRWAAAVAATWVTVRETESALPLVSSARLAALFRAARDHAVPRLLDIARAELETRAETAEAEDPLWDVLTAIPEVSPLERQWVAQLIGNMRERSNITPAVKQARALPLPELQRDPFIDAVAATDAAAALPALSIALQRQAAGHRLNERQRILQVSEEVGRWRAIVRDVPSRIRSALSTVPESVLRVHGEASEQLRQIDEQLRELAQYAEPELARSAGLNHALDLSDLVKSLHALRFDPRRPTDEARALRAALVDELSRASAGDDLRAHEVRTALPALAPEAVGVVLEVGVTTRSTVLLAGVPALLAAQSWAQPQWDAVILQFAGLDPRPLPIVDAVASATRDRLLQKLLAPVEITLFSEHAAALRSSAEEIVRTVETEVAQLVSELTSIVRSIRESL